MNHSAELDVSVKETSVCIVDDTGKIVREVKVVSEPEALLGVLKNPGYHFKRIGLEAGPLSQWLYSALAEAGLPVICVETRHMRAVLKAQINKRTFGSELIPTSVSEYGVPGAAQRIRAMTRVLSSFRGASDSERTRNLYSAALGLWMPGSRSTTAPRNDDNEFSYSCDTGGSRSSAQFLPGSG